LVQLLPLLSVNLSPVHDQIYISLSTEATCGPLGSVRDGHASGARPANGHQWRVARSARLGVPQAPGGHGKRRGRPALASDEAATPSTTRTCPALRDAAPPNQTPKRRPAVGRMSVTCAHAPERSPSRSDPPRPRARPRRRPEAAAQHQRPTPRRGRRLPRARA
jgi:hypothetical protein